MSELILASLDELGYTFRLNLLDGTIEMNGEPCGDELEAQIRTALRDRDVRPLSAAADMLGALVAIGALPGPES